MATHLRREAFDRNREFVVAKSLSIRGDKYGPNDTFDKNLVNTRRLRQLYDTRYLRMTSAQPKYEPAPFDASKLSDEQLILFLEDNGIIPRFGMNREWLLEKVSKLLADAGVVAGTSSTAGTAANASHPAPRKPVRRQRIKKG